MSELRAATEGPAKNVNLVFEGGGLKGIGLVGAYSAPEEQVQLPRERALALYDSGRARDHAATGL